MGEHVYEVDDYHIQVVVFQLIILVKKFVGSHGVVDLMIAEGVVTTISVELSLYEGCLVEVLAFFLFLVYPQVWKHLGYLVWHQSTEDGIARILGGSGENAHIHIFLDVEEVTDVMCQHFPLVVAEIVDNDEENFLALVEVREYLGLEDIGTHAGAFLVLAEGCELLHPVEIVLGNILGKA